MYALNDYHFDLPEALIAQVPKEQRDHSRLMIVNRDTGQWAHRRFHQVSSELRSGDVLVINNTKVTPVRLFGRKSTGGKVELLVLEYADPARTQSGPNGQSARCLIKASKQCSEGTILQFNKGLQAEVQAFEDGIYAVTFTSPGGLEAAFDQTGFMPLPPYIKRSPDAMPPCDDRQSYQTVYASEKGAIAAPTAGLHFTRALLDRLSSQGVEIVEITLHVGYGTFLPVRVADIRDHRMHTEMFHISKTAAGSINRARSAGRQVVAVGTTSVRTLEYVSNGSGMVQPGSGACDLFIYPGFQFSIIDAMITNFHLPESTLLMLVSAFAGRERILAAYQEAVRQEYRFFSYGDAMMIK
jgi:S-adenosylmethionine:tRNA ribosyltransferase-isomerase